jgi:hypothetical protein
MSDLESKLQGKTLQVYSCLLREKGEPIGVRHVQRSLGFSSPSVAAYHLEKLVDLGLAEKLHGDYALKKEVKIGAMANFILIGRFLLPRHLFYAVLFTSMLITYLSKYSFSPSPHSFAALLFGSLASIILWYETVKIIRRKPF